MDEILDQIEAEIIELFEDERSGHDIHHLKRVLNLALHIQEREGGDRLVIGAAALLHDVHRIMQNQSGRYYSPKESLPTVKQILDKTSLPKEKKNQVLHCVEYHEEYGFTSTGKTVDDIETLVLQDADNLDAIGAIGIGRAFAYGSVYGSPMWVPDIPFEEGYYDDASGKDPSVLHHFYSKLFRLKENMNTPTGHAMAEGRHHFMKQFATEFLEEWSGRK